MDFSLPANASLLLAFAKLPDPRKERNRLYPLTDIFAVVLTGMICGANDIMAAYFMGSASQGLVCIDGSLPEWLAIV
jgi:hypothetical protein